MQADFKGKGKSFFFLSRVFHFFWLANNHPGARSVPHAPYSIKERGNKDESKQVSCLVCTQRPFFSNFFHAKVLVHIEKIK